MAYTHRTYAFSSRCGASIYILRMKPFIESPVLCDCDSDAELSAQTGVPAPAFQAVREGEPHPLLRKYLRDVADAVGCCPKKLAANVRAAEEKTCRPTLCADPEKHRRQFGGMMRR